MLENILKLLDKWNNNKKVIEQKKKTIFIKENKYYYTFMFHSKTDGERKSTTILSQIKAVDVKRIKFKLGVIRKEDFEILHCKFLSCIEPKEIVTPHKSEESPEGICSAILPQKNKEVKL